MGATNCPETPRQRMIGMMYLVLTAMLALNVSKDILNAFSIVDEALHTSNQITVSKNAQDYAELNNQKAILGEEKVAEAFGKAMQIKELSNEMVEYIEQVKIKYIEYVDETAYNEDGTIKTVAELRAKDNISKANNFMMLQGNAKVLKDKVENYRNQLLSFVDEQDREAMAQTIGLDVNEKFRNATGVSESWERHYFEDVIFAAGVTLLNKTVGEVRNAESGILKYVIRSITRNDFNFSNVTAKVIPKSQIVFVGEPYEADIIVAAYDDKQPIDAYWRPGTGMMTSTQGASLVRGESGVAHLRISANNVGDFNFTGLIQMIGPDGVPQQHPFTDKYTVMAAAATSAADKMNVLYAGIDNPVSVTASVAAEKTSITLSAGTYTQTGPGKYDIKVPENLASKTVTINIFANIDGKQQAMNSNVFRVKRVPDPEPRVGSVKGLKTSKAELLANPFITAGMGSDFVYDLSWTVKSYQVTFIIKGIEDPPMMCNNKSFSEAVISKINSCGVGTVIYFSDIKVASVAGDRTLNPVTVILK
ncbi:MAG: gliding motility protein GldM [Bacteroidetes bacterium]|nr:gliding motility protein GldM [Bacteroidota bacterium]MCL1969471.1 gliding motility protein GldM [Bacteroidota bacterium]